MQCRQGCKSVATLSPSATLTRRAACPLRCFLFLVQAVALVLGALWSAADRTAAEGAQLQATIAAAPPSATTTTL